MEHPVNTTVYKHHKYSLTVYLILAMGITWLGWIPGLIIGAQQGYIMPNFTTYTISYVLFVFVVQLFTSRLGEEPGWRENIRCQHLPHGKVLKSHEKSTSNNLVAIGFGDPCLRGLSGGAGKYQ